MRPLTFLICLASIVFLAGLSARSVDTTVPGATVCEPLTEVGQYWVRATATDTDVNQSGLSTEIVKTLPGDVCWENPSQNIDNSPLTDLAFVTLLYSTSPIVAGGTGPNSVTIRPNSVSCPGCDNLAANLLVGETGKEVAVAWDALPGADEIRIQVVGYGGTVPIISGVSCNISVFETLVCHTIALSGVPSQYHTCSGVQLILIVYESFIAAIKSY